MLLHHIKALSEPFRSDSGCRLFIYGVGACYPAADYEAAYHQKGALNSYEAAAQSKQNRKNNLPDCGNNICGFASSVCHPACRLPYARQPLEGIRRLRTSLQDCSKRAYEHCNHILRHFGRRYHYRKGIP